VSWKKRQPSPGSASRIERTTIASATIVRTPFSTGTSKDTSSRAPTGCRAVVLTKNPPRDRSRIVPEYWTPSRQNVIDHSTAAPDHGEERFRIEGQLEHRVRARAPRLLLRSGQRDHRDRRLRERGVRLEHPAEVESRHARHPRLHDDHLRVRAAGDV
jgi:hypothetical protein